MASPLGDCTPPPVSRVVATAMWASRRSDRIHELLRRLNREYVYRLGRIRVAWRQRGLLDVDVGRLIRVRPREVQSFKTEFDGLTSHKAHDRGKVLSGDWDLRARPLDEYLGIVPSFARHFGDGVPWEETTYYRYLRARIEAGWIEQGCRFPEEVDRRFERLDRLYDAIRRSGYRSQAELVANGLQPPDALLGATDEVAVHIGWEGRLILADGVHRLVIAQLLALPMIPVSVVIRHRQWVERRRALRGAAGHGVPTEGSERPHPDVDSGPSDCPQSKDPR